MITSHRYVAAGLLAMGLWISAPACASGNYGRYRSGGVYRDLDRRAYDNGFRSGVSHGEDDAHDRRDFRVDRDGDYRSADDGYRRRDGYDRDDYRRAFRQGYETGYAQGYNRIARGYDGRVRRSGPPVVVGPRGGGVAVPALVEAKIRLYEAMEATRVGKAELGRRLNWHGPQVDRLLQVKHGSQLDQLEAEPIW
jgi:hypothetical protein